MTSEEYTNKILNGDCLEVLKTLPDKICDCCVTSPPYYGLRDYGTGTWIGGDPNCPHRRTSKFSPNTSTGHVRRELKEKIEKDYSYKRLCRKSINTDPHIFNLLQMAFMRSGTHIHHMFSQTLSCMM